MAWLAVALAALACGYALRIVRWWMMLRAMDPAVRLGACVRPFLVSIAVNNLLPFRAGDAVRVVGFRDELQAPPMRVLGTMLVERLLDLSTLLVFFFIGLSGTSPGGVPPAFVTAAAWMAAVGAALVLTLLLLASRLEAISEAIGRWPARASARDAVVDCRAGPPRRRGARRPAHAGDDRAAGAAVLRRVAVRGAGVRRGRAGPLDRGRAARAAVRARDRHAGDAAFRARPATSARSTISPRSAWSPTARRAPSRRRSPSSCT